MKSPHSTKVRSEIGATRLPRLRNAPGPCAARLEKIRWTTGAAFELDGARIGIRVSDSAVWPEVLARLPPGTRPLGSSVVDHMVSWLVGTRPRTRPRRRHALFANGRLLTRTEKIASALDVLERHVALAFAEMSKKRVYVHAGVAAINGRAIVIPGRSGAGKTFLVRELLERGALFYSDEYAVIDPQGRVHPYPRALRVSGPRGERRLTPAQLGAALGTRPIRVSRVLVTEHERGARFRPRDASSGKGALALFAHTIHARHVARRVMPVLARVAAGARVTSSRRGEASVVADWLFDTGSTLKDR